MFRYISRLALFLSLSPTQAATIAPRIPGATITLSTISGNGCPSGSVTLTDTRGDMATLNYKQFTTSLGPDVSSASKTKNCLARIKIATPPGYIVSIKDTKYEGRAELSAGATMLSQTTYYFADDPAAQSSTQDRVQGPGVYGLWRWGEGGGGGDYDEACVDEFDGGSEWEFEFGESERTS
ncbi:hypothetical protein OQA88_5222 [Cercophora sp. LCS_1]